MGYMTPAIIDWLLAQRRGQPSSTELLLSITDLSDAVITTGVPWFDIAGFRRSPGSERDPGDVGKHDEPRDE